MQYRPIENTPSAIAPAARLVHLASPTSTGCGCNDGKEHDCGLCPMTQLEFPNFFAGQLVQPDDLTAIERRVFSHEQLRARHTIGWGIACGFRVGLDPAADPNVPGGMAKSPYIDIQTIPVKGSTLRIESGYGIDRFGRDVYLADDRTYALEALFAERDARVSKAMADPWCAIPGCQPTPPTHYCIAVRYKECPDKMVPSYAQQCGTPKTVCEPSRIREDIEIRVFGDNEFPDIPQQTLDGGTWCGLPREEQTMAAIFTRMLEIPIGTTDVASSATWSAYSTLSAKVSNTTGTVAAPTESVATSGSCEDLLHLPRACEPCLDWPWIPLACFTRDGENVTPPDCRVRRTIYSLQQLEALVVRIFCQLFNRTDEMRTTDTNSVLNLYR